MAILDNRNKEYYKVNQSKSFGNIDGLYIEVIVYLTKEDRDKEKMRQREIETFMYNVSTKINNLRQEGNENDMETLYQLEHIVNSFNSNIYHVSGEEKIHQVLDPGLLEILVNLGFNKEWYDDPIVIARIFTIRAKDYEKDGFEMDHLYNSVKPALVEFGMIEKEDDILDI